MASKYLMDAVKGYDDYLLKHGLDESVLQAYVLATGFLDWLDEEYEREE